MLKYYSMIEIIDNIKFQYFFQPPTTEIQKFNMRRLSRILTNYNSYNIIETPTIESVVDTMTKFSPEVRKIDKDIDFEKIVHEIESGSDLSYSIHQVLHNGGFLFYIKN